MPLFSLFQRETREEKEEKERRRKEEEEERLRQRELARKAALAERNDMLLPWNLEQKVAVVLNPVKIPFIVIVGIVGSLVESRIAWAAGHTWWRNLWSVPSFGTECVVHELHNAGLKVDSDKNDALSKLTRAMDKVYKPIMEFWNNTAHSIANCTKFPDSNSSLCIIGPTLLDERWEHDYCGLEEDTNIVSTTTDIGSTTTNEGRCKPPDQGEQSEYMRDTDNVWAGVGKKIPYFPKALLWMFFKLLFIPGHYVDRIHRVVVGTDPPPEPMLKLLAEPTCAKDGSCGAAGPKFSKLGAVCKAIRFSLLPNTLILPLSSVRFHPKCKDDYIVYSADTTVGFFIYCWLIWDLACTVGAYVMGMTVFKGQALGQTWYRCGKCASICGTIVALNFFLLDLYCTLQPRFWIGLHILLRLGFTVDHTWGFTLDIVRTVATVVMTLDALQFTILIMSLLCPVFLGKVSRFVPERVQKYADRPGDLGHDDAAGADGTDSHLLSKS